MDTPTIEITNTKWIGRGTYRVELDGPLGPSKLTVVLPYVWLEFYRTGKERKRIAEDTAIESYLEGR